MGRIKRSFTLIELIIAVGVTALILPAVFAIFFAIIRQQLVLIAYQTIKREGDSIQRNIKNMLQQRAVYRTDGTYSYLTSEEVCPLITTPTPTFSPDLYMVDRDGQQIHVFPTPTSTSVTHVASASASKTYLLSSDQVSVTNMGFSCYRLNEFTPPIITTSFTVQKSTYFKEISLSYLFSTRLRAY